MSRQEYDEANVAENEAGAASALATKRAEEAYAKIEETRQKLDELWNNPTQ